MMNRRDAMKGVAAGIAVAGMSSAATARSSSDTVVIGAVGCGGRGRAHARFLAGRKDGARLVVYGNDGLLMQQAMESVFGKLKQREE